MEELNDTIEQLNLTDVGRTCAPADIIPFLSFPLQKNFSVLVFILLDLLAAHCMVDHSLFFATLLLTWLSGHHTLFLVRSGH